MRKWYYGMQNDDYFEVTDEVFDIIVDTADLIGRYADLREDLSVEQIIIGFPDARAADARLRNVLTAEQYVLYRRAPIF